MLRVAEFCEEFGLARSINGWLAENQDKKVIDIKYSADATSSNALIMYEDCEVKEDKITTFQDITVEELIEVINTREPLGKFWTKENGAYVGIDNTEGEAYVEEFNTLEECFKWLNGKERDDG